MRCPWYLFHRLFCVWARTQGPHDPLLPRGPMSCQSAPGAGWLCPGTDLTVSGYIPYIYKHTYTFLHTHSAH
ncbi:unnamed protein product [Staurois parvus]|uniref:Secreted protein n=1 Tax=Staurois parvus TaxID=386267 RepID=A0ABN9FBG0_9NEOB|nr:unnamed protein product [Staurois parvus]